MELAKLVQKQVILKDLLLTRQTMDAMTLLAKVLVRFGTQPIRYATFAQTTLILRLTESLISTAALIFVTMLLIILASTEPARLAMPTSMLMLRPFTEAAREMTALTVLIIFWLGVTKLPVEP
jgi:hypothetical protein